MSLSICEETSVASDLGCSNERQRIAAVGSVTNAKLDPLAIL